MAPHRPVENRKLTDAPSPRHLVVVWLYLVFLSPAHAETFTGKVVRILDGDTVEVLDVTNTSHRFRLAGINAPEKAQPFGTKAKESRGLRADPSPMPPWKFRHKPAPVLDCPCDSSKVCKAPKSGAVLPHRERKEAVSEGGLDRMLESTRSFVPGQEYLRLILSSAYTWPTPISGFARATLPPWPRA